MRIKVLIPGLRPLMLTFMLLVSSGASFPQTQGNRLLEKADVKGQFATGHSALNIPFEFEYNEIVLRVRVNNRFTFTQIENLLMENAVERSLALRRDGKTVVVKFTLRRLI